MEEQKEKKHYSKAKYLNEKEILEFESFLKEYDISTQELAEIEGLGHRRETMAGRLRRKRILRGFANQVMEAKENQVKEKADSLKGRRF